MMMPRALAVRAAAALESLDRLDRQAAAHLILTPDEINLLIVHHQEAFNEAQAEGRIGAAERHMARTTELINLKRGRPADATRQ